MVIKDNRIRTGYGIINDNIIAATDSNTPLESERILADNQDIIWERIFEESTWGMVISDADSGKLLRMNSSYARMHGCEPGELTGKSLYDIFAPEFHQFLPEIINIIHEKGHYVYDAVHVKKDGSHFPVHVETSEVTVNGKRLRIVSVWDTTETRKREIELLEYRERLEELVEQRTHELKLANAQLLKEIKKKEIAENSLEKINREMLDILESINDRFLTVNKDWIITFVNQSLLKNRQAKGLPTKLIGENFWEVFELGNEFIKDSCIRVMANKQTERFEAYSNLVKEWLEINIYPASDGISLFMRNIDERKTIEKAIEAEHNRLYTLFDIFPGMISIMEENYNIRYANISFRQMFGSVIGVPCYQVMCGLNQPCNNCTILKADHWPAPIEEEGTFKNRIYEIFTHQFIDADGSKLTVKIMIDITEKKNAERELARLERLNIVGEMAAGIAHEIRNPMTTVRGFLQMLSTKDDAKHYLEFYQLMIEELDRANQIITEFLSVARDKPSDFVLVNISGIAKSLYPLLSADAMNNDKEIKLELEQVEDISGNENELRQLILNLARNGLEAMQPGKLLLIRSFMEGRHVKLMFYDQGEGFDPTVLQKLGTPFLTTKEKGTGLGLAICQSIVSRHGATMKIEPNHPAGTIITIIFSLPLKQ